MWAVWKIDPDGDCKSFDLWGLFHDQSLAQEAAEGLTSSGKIANIEELHPIQAMWVASYTFPEVLEALYCDELVN